MILLLYLPPACGRTAPSPCLLQNTTSRHQHISFPSIINSQHSLLNIQACYICAGMLSKACFEARIWVHWPGSRWALVASPPRVSEKNAETPVKHQAWSFLCKSWWGGELHMTHKEVEEVPENLNGKLPERFPVKVHVSLSLSHTHSRSQTHFIRCCWRQSECVFDGSWLQTHSSHCDYRPS